MIDIKLLRENPERLKKAISLKKFDCDLDAILDFDAKRRSIVSAAEEARAAQNAANLEMSKLPKGSDEFKAKIAELKEVSAKVKSLEKEADEADKKWNSMLLTIPNMPDPSVPVGKNEADNVTVSTWGDVNSIKNAKPHWDLPFFEKMLDFQRGVKVTGAGFPFYVGDMARLVRALLAFFLDEAKKNGYEEMMCPIMVNAASATATGQLPDKEGQMYHDAQDDFYMIPTAEVPLTNFFRNETFDEKDLPIYRCGYTPCFRREAGSWGKDVRGLNRLHQFDKVELVKWVHPDTSMDELEKLRLDAERILQKLELPYRVLMICTGDIGFPHAKQFDLEVWAAGQQKWLEVSSCSCFTDFQARRAGIRFRPANGGKSQFVHTLNGSGLAIPRVLAAILENNITDDGKIRVPQVLRKWIDEEFIG
ncbi:serine--tRNA ligase [Intestinicryptomonas porci]|uniref:Serine--tRNA ligase n=1 Tax=Intestinicryptomonas porci TaxID=2926320 RepID=A0ABU4WJD2_9BACT|nr:serine--tRNA ligase [Opitutales bacterium CLA-KB-P66]